MKDVSRCKDSSKTFLSYKDENDNIINAHVNIIEFNESFIKFETKSNIIIIPINRILKMKEGKKNGY